jgi:hypothetical protein
MLVHTSETRLKSSWIVSLLLNLAPLPNRRLVLSNGLVTETGQGAVVTRTLKVVASVAKWHKADVPNQPVDVRFRGKNGLTLLLP